MTRLDVDISEFRFLASRITKKMGKRALTKGVNAGGRHVRMVLPRAIEEQGNFKAGSIKRRSKARAAYAGSENPAYRLEMPGEVGVAKLRSLAGPRKGKAGPLRFRSGFGKRRIVFSQAEVTGQGKTKAFRLLAARGRRARHVGGVRLPRDLFTNPEYVGIQKALRDAAERSMAAYENAIRIALAKRRP